jgi:saccharopine dehydrogenase-like NADP-dependent oxidoreductase
MGQMKELATRMGPEIRQLDGCVIPQIKHAVMSGHDEVHSLAAHYPQADIRFWMGFGDHYMDVFKVLQNLDLLSEQPVVTAEGLEVVPLKVVKAVLPDPSGLAPDYNGKTCIGDLV